MCRAKCIDTQMKCKCIEGTIILSQRYIIFSNGLTYLNLFICIHFSYFCYTIFLFLTCATERHHFQFTSKRCRFPFLSRGGLLIPRLALLCLRASPEDLRESILDTGQRFFLNEISFPPLFLASPSALKD